MEWSGRWNGTEISVWNMEDARMEWNRKISRMEWKIFSQISILDFALVIYRKTYADSDN